MRPSQKSNRNRGKNNRPKGLGNVVNRVFESAGPEGKVRGTPQQIIDKYEQLARDAQTAGDRVTAENFLQHSEHYLRMLSAAQAEQQAHQQSQQPNSQPQPNGQSRRDDDDGRQPSSEQPQPDASNEGRREEARKDEGRKDDAPRAEGGKPEGGGRRSRKSDAAKEPAKETPEQPAGGMQTIDSEGADDGPSLVATPEAGEEAPRPRPRRRRTRRDKPAEGEAQASDEPKGDADTAAVSG